jgi:hypothetical protein
MSTTSNTIPNYLPTSTMPTDLDLLNNYLQCPYYQLYGPPPSYDSIVQMSDEQAQCVLMCTTSLVDENTAAAVPTSTATTSISSHKQQMTLLIGENGKMLTSTTSPEHFCEMQTSFVESESISTTNPANSYELDALQPSILLRKTDKLVQQQQESKSVSINLDEFQMTPISKRKSIRHAQQLQLTEHQQPSTSSASTNTN